VAGGAAHAAGPSADGSRPGRVYVHLLGQTSDPSPYALVDLMCHEGVPGHVMQGDIQIGQTSGPRFRQAARYVAFGEGWGLYAEALCKEMGAYPDRASDFLRLEAELFRAARLVVAGFFQQVFDRITIPAVRDALARAIGGRIRRVS
jgi:uncharacterized protein (DUF885 family)